jgi:hypothetical protein
MREPWVVSTCTWLLLATTAAYCQSTTRVTLPVSPECVDAAQSTGPFASPQVAFVENPKPFSMSGFDSPPLKSELTARIVNSHPLIVDVVDVGGSMTDKDGRARLCGFTTLSAVDIKLKPVLSSLKFGQVVKLTGFLAGTDFKDWKFVITRDKA